MIKEILTAAGVEHARGRFLRTPAGTYAVYFDDIEVETADRTPNTNAPRIYHHDVTVEVYEPKLDDEIEAAIEAELDTRGIAWGKQDRYWLKDLQRYQIVYDLAYTTKSK